VLELLTGFEIVKQYEWQHVLPFASVSGSTHADSKERLDHCLVSYLRQAGVQVTFTLLQTVGILGNGHFGMLEKNSDSIASYFERWIRKNIQ